MVEISQKHHHFSSKEQVIRFVDSETSIWIPITINKVSVFRKITSETSRQASEYVGKESADSLIVDLWIGVACGPPDLYIV